MSIKTRVHVAMFVVGLVEVEIKDAAGDLDIAAELVHLSQPTINGSLAPALTARVDGEDASQAMNERVTRVAGHLCLMEAESILRRKIESSGASMQEKAPEAVDTKGVKA